MAPIEPPGRVDPTTYVDEVRYVVRLTQLPSGAAETVTEGFVAFWGELDVSLEDAAKLATRAAWDPERQIHEPFVAKQSFTQFEWGASGYGLSFLVDVLNNISADLVVAGMAYAIGRMRGKKQREAAWSPQEGLEFAPQDALRAVEAVFGESYDDLVVEGAVQVQDSIVVHVRGAHGTYSATLTALDTGDPVCHVIRTAD